MRAPPRRALSLRWQLQDSRSFQTGCFLVSILLHTLSQRSVAVPVAPSPDAATRLSARRAVTTPHARVFQGLVACCKAVLTGGCARACVCPCVCSSCRPLTGHLRTPPAWTPSGQVWPPRGCRAQQGFQGPFLRHNTEDVRQVTGEGRSLTRTCSPAPRHPHAACRHAPLRPLGVPGAGHGAPGAPRRRSTVRVVSVPTATLVHRLLTQPDRTRTEPAPACVRVNETLAGKGRRLCAARGLVAGEQPSLR